MYKELFSPLFDNTNFMLVIIFLISKYNLHKNVRF